VSIAKPIDYLDKECSRALILSMSNRGMKFSDRLEKKIKRWRKKIVKDEIKRE